MKYSTDAQQDSGSAGETLQFLSFSVSDRDCPIDYYRNLIAYEIPLNEMMSRVPMILRLGSHKDEAEPLTPVQKRALRQAQKSWDTVINFYETREPALLKRANNEMVGKKETPLNYRLAMQCSTAIYQADIYQAHERLVQTMKNLDQAGFGHENYQPESEKLGYRESA